MRFIHLLMIVLCLSVIGFGVACKDKEVTISKDIVVLIESPSKLYYREGDAIEFAGSGASNAGDVADSQLEWTSSKDGVIGSGSVFARDDLTVGTHEITLTAVNVDGEKFDDSTTIEIRKRRKREKTAPKREKWFRRIKDPVDGGLYIEVYDGTVVDMSTGLMWERSPDNAQRSFKGAINYAKNLRLGGHTGWRVPTLHELRRISNISFSSKYRRMLNISTGATVHSAAISNVFESMNGHFWALETSTPYVMIANKRYGHAVRYEFDFTVNYFRGTYTPYQINKPGYVRCVRNVDLKKWRRILANNK